MVQTYDTQDSNTLDVPETDSTYFAEAQGKINDDANAKPSITLDDNIVVPKGQRLTIPEGKIVTLNLNGRNITAAEEFTGTAIENHGTLTVKGAGALNFGAG